MTQGDTESFDITFDLTGSPPVYTRNCARIESPVLTPRPMDCAELGQQLAALPRLPGSVDEAVDEIKKRKRIKLPKVKVDLGGLLGRKKSAEDEKEEE